MLPRCGGRVPSYVPCSGRRAISRRSRNSLSLRQTRVEDPEQERGRQRELLLRTAQAELAHVARVSMMGELTASIAHEVLQALAGITTCADAGQRWLAASPPELARCGHVSIGLPATSQTRAITSPARCLLK
jgi:C4-dicarboxylate-specific signal transduction histidine kinase